MAGGNVLSPITEQQAIRDRPIRVVVFCSGPKLEQDVQRFLVRLEAHPDIELLRVFCQSTGQTYRDITQDLWRRRRWLAIPLLALHVWEACVHAVVNPRRWRELRRQLTEIAERISYVPDIHAPEVVAEIRALAPDLGASYGSPILKPVLFELPTLGTLGIHHGKVPEYRGKKTTFWAMYHGEPEVGVTIQKINAGLDTGQIVNSGSVFTGHHSYASVWGELVDLGLDLYIQSIVQVRNATAIYRPQEGPKGKLFRDPKAGDILRFWRQQVSRRVFRT